MSHKRHYNSKGIFLWDRGKSLIIINPFSLCKTFCYESGLKSLNIPFGITLSFVDPFTAYCFDSIRYFCQIPYIISAHGLKFIFHGFNPFSWITIWYCLFKGGRIFCLSNVIHIFTYICLKIIWNGRSPLPLWSSQWFISNHNWLRNELRFFFWCHFISYLLIWWLIWALSMNGNSRRLRWRHSLSCSRNCFLKGYR